MKKEDLVYFKKWFSEFTKSYYIDNSEDQRNILLKVEHSHNVCKNIIDIAEALNFSEDRIMLAEAIALFHDIGRFPQYAEYRTFRDADSMNHGLLGAKTLQKEKVLCMLPDNEQQLIVDTVRFHGVYAIPSVLNGDDVLFLKLVRDADKVDIFRVFVEYYDSPEEERASATAFGVPDTPEYSKEMLSCILSGSVASYADIRTENDFRLMKLSWIFDMNFNESIRLIQKRDSLDRIIEKLPKTNEIKSAAECVHDYISERLSNE